MKIIAIEGLDKSGKATATRFLRERLAAQGLTVEVSEFHRYDTPTGSLIMKWLTKQWDVDQHTVELVMTADKQAQQKWFRELEENGLDILILDRYTLSQEVYAKANDVDPMWTESLQRYMRQPDIDIYIDIPAEVSMSRKGKHNNGENDRYESDVAMLNRVRNSYLAYHEYWIANGGPAIIVNGEQTIEKVHEDIWKQLEPLLKQGGVTL